MARDIVVIGASAGGLEALVRLVRELPRELPASIFVVVHIWPHSISVLHEILQRHVPLTVSQARHGDPIRHGHIYVAPPDHHLRVGNPGIELSTGPRENGFRPAIDPLFRSAAQTFGTRVIGIILSGSLDDGSLGIEAVKRGGGMTVVQDPQEAAFSEMPLNAIDERNVDHVLKAAEIGKHLQHWVSEPITHKGAQIVSEDQNHEAEIIRGDFEQFEQGSNGPTFSSVLTCPDCGGVMWALPEGGHFRYRCHVGHSFSLLSLLNEQFEAVETALWTAVRVLEERAALLKRMALSAAGRGSHISEENFTEQAQEARDHADLIRSLLLNGKLGQIEPLEPD